MAGLGSLYEKQNRLEEAYQCYLEAAMGKDRYALELLSEMYRKGIYVRKDETRAEELINLTDDKTLIQLWEAQYKRAEGKTHE